GLVSDLLPSPSTRGCDGAYVEHADVAADGWARHERHGRNERHEVILRLGRLRLVVLALVGAMAASCWPWLASQGSARPVPRRDRDDRSNANKIGSGGRPASYSFRRVQ